MAHVVETFVDKINNNKLFADRSAKDADGNDIVETYAKKSQIPAPQPQVNADWDASSGVAQILNKPDLSQYATLSDVNGKQNTLNETEDISLGGQAGGQWPRVRLKSLISGGTNLSGLRHNYQSAEYVFGTAHNNEGPNNSSYATLTLSEGSQVDPYGDMGFAVDDGYAFQSLVYIILIQGVTSWSQVTNNTPFAVSVDYYDFAETSYTTFSSFSANNQYEHGYPFDGYNGYDNYNLRGSYLVLFTDYSYGQPTSITDIASYANTNWNPQSWEPEHPVPGVSLYTTNPVYDAGLSLDPETGPAALGLATVASSGSYNDLSDKPTIPTVPTAGNMLSTTNNVLNVTTTAGITDVQLVQSMPASPVATVLYLIPEN